MTYFGLNAEFIEVKGIERLCSTFREENQAASSDLSAVSTATDLKQVLFIMLGNNG